MNKSEALQLLRQALGDRTAQFRNDQWEAIDALVNNREKLLLVQQTGWGKSVVYFIATRILRNRGLGPTLIVSPLLSLIRNQQSLARKFGINAQSINSANWTEHNAIKQNLGAIDVLLISPERLANENFTNQVLAPISGEIGMIVVDEAHCISDWGYDFRPDYRRLVNLLQRIPPNTPVLGTTATANNRVIDDVKYQLGDLTVIRGSLMRRSLHLQNMPNLSKFERLSWLISNINYLPRTGLIYTLTKRAAISLAEILRNNQIDAEAYHAGLDNEKRVLLEEKLQQNQIKVLVCTTALGMGYDKPDLGFVIHYQIPSSVISYYQQIGRAGRSGEPSLCVLMSGPEDAAINDYFRKNAFPTKEQVKIVLYALELGDGLSDEGIGQIVNLRIDEIRKALKYLSVENPAPIMKDGHRWRRTSVVYHLNENHIKRLNEQRISEWNQMQKYLNLGQNDCLMEFLAYALNDPNPHPCGKCSNCLGHPVVEHGDVHVAKNIAMVTVKPQSIPLVPKTYVPPAAFTRYSFFSGAFFPPRLQAKTGMILSRWRDEGFGNAVAEDKEKRKFRDELVNELAERIHKHWMPKPPVWVTCIPSSTDLVRDFSERLAGKLGLDFVDTLNKLVPNDPQKLQQNEYYQCRNLDGVFGIADDIRNAPVILVDDIVDSGWTMAVAGALLLDAGCAEVWPVALASSTPGQ